MLNCQEIESQLQPVAGVDEVGRGALFGAVVAAAVILPVDRFSVLHKAGVTDSKRLAPQRRATLDRLIREVAVDCQVGMATVEEIDRMNILEASLLAMERSIAKLKIKPNHCLIDGNQPLRFRLIEPLPQTTVVKGDATCLSIAAASIVAKVWRDRLMTELDLEYPGYDLAKNKGYGTVKHREAILRLGYSDRHRQSFRIQEYCEDDSRVQIF
ncbi:ribonuclease HII [Pseudanabaena sp. PCC 6802]|uniref:ribonuclease HII n=1 Tax=Pseudanabaena sp. PCC 6802 TaxID=118173 RepID=UPI00034D3F9C|nr:ribonuclease HII [Pseudanabaena sp. PCC 6802]